MIATMTDLAKAGIETDWDIPCTNKLTVIAITEDNMKIHKFSGYAITTNDKGDEYLKQALATTSLQHFHDEIAELDPHDLTIFQPNCDLADCEKYFKAEPTTGGRDIQIGGLYRHFKGKTVKVLMISQDTENPGSFSVVYECMDGANAGKFWHRPLDMFISEVDREKYPDATQHYRFELIEEEPDELPFC